ncbi:hypothetical protein EV44_g3211 [Erysiphe necator]|uniref:Uncharacterized protein n=1 Tax=Uncinula necator TaxID=52586 RepID=A0A0B1P1S0_UNCNE|nr:hypothetical protein EV44_g3211 [Erysiphe necator]
MLESYTTETLKKFLTKKKKEKKKKKNDTEVPETFEEIEVQQSDENATESNVSDGEVEVAENKLRSTGTNDHIVRFDHLIKEIEQWDFKVVQIDSESLEQFLGKFVEIGSIVHKLSPDDLTIIANMDGDYDGKV